MSIFKRQAIIKLTEKSKDKRSISIKGNPGDVESTCRPISVLNIYYKIIMKVLATRWKNILRKMYSSEQTAYVKKGFLGKITVWFLP